VTATPIIASVSPQAYVVEVGVGARFGFAERLLDEHRGVDVLLVDVNEAALEGAPDRARTAVDDVTRPRLSLYRGAEWILARRCPAELQPALARLARRVDACLAVRALKDEWAPLPVGITLDPVEGASGWRVWRPGRTRTTLG
jgi:uncharacterized UPF0146 family protein